MRFLLPFLLLPGIALAQTLGSPALKSATVGAPTGGNEGTGTINAASGYYLNGTATIPAGTTGTPLCESGTASQAAGCGSSTVLTNGTTATTQTTGDSSAKIATDATVIADIGGYSSADATPVPTGYFKLPPIVSAGGFAVTSGSLYLLKMSWPAGSATIKNVTIRIGSTGPSPAYLAEGCLYPVVVTGASIAPGPLVTGGDTTATSTGTSAYATVTLPFPSAITPTAGYYYVGLLIGGTVTGTVYSGTVYPQGPVSNFVSGMGGYQLVQTGITVGSAGTSNCPSTPSASSGSAANVPITALGG